MENKNNMGMTILIITLANLLMSVSSVVTACLSNLTLDQTPSLNKKFLHHIGDGNEEK